MRCPGLPRSVGSNEDGQIEDDENEDEDEEELQRNHLLPIASTHIYPPLPICKLHRLYTYCSACQPPYQIIQISVIGSLTYPWVKVSTHGKYHSRNPRRGAYMHLHAVRAPASSHSFVSLARRHTHRPFCVKRGACACVSVRLTEFVSGAWSV
ncbi:hypothetical protein V8C44DRAFT_146479 [Trichoderma aethiopicum]